MYVRIYIYISIYLTVGIARSKASNSDPPRNNNNGRNHSLRRVHIFKQHCPFRIAPILDSALLFMHFHFVSDIKWVDVF